MADQSLIRGQAAVSGARAAKGMAFRTGLAESLQQNLTNVAQAYELREQKIRDGEAMANANLLSYDPNNNLPPKYQDLIRQKTEEANNKINEIGKDIGISNTAKNAAMIKIVRDAENDIKGYVDYVNLEMDSMKLVKKIADPNIGQDISSTLSNEVIDIVNKVAGGDYTLDNNNNYIFEGDSKIYNKNEIKDLVDQYSNSIYDVNAVKQAKFSLIEAAAKSKSIQEYNSGVDAKLKLYNPNNPKDQASLKKELATIYGYTAEQLQQIEKEGGDYIGALKEELYDIGQEFVPKPKMAAASGSEAYMNIRNTTNRYIQQGNLPQQLFGKTINNKRVVSAVPGPNNTLKIGLDAGFTTENGERIQNQIPVILDLNKVDDLYKIDTAIAEEIYTGKDLQEFKEYYTKALNIKVEEEDVEKNQIKVNEVTLTPQEQAANWGTVTSSKQDRKIISSELYNITTPEIRGAARRENNPAGSNYKRDEELIGKDGKVADAIVVTEEFRNKYPNYPYAAYKQDDASMLAKIDRSVKTSIIKKLNITSTQEKADIYNNKISLQRYNELKQIADLTPEEKKYLVLSGTAFNELEQQNFDI